MSYCLQRKKHCSHASLATFWDFQLHFHDLDMTLNTKISYFRVFKIRCPNCQFLTKCFSNIRTDAKQFLYPLARIFALPQSMPWLNKKTTQAKQQRSKSRTNFISTSDDIDSDSIYSLSSDQSVDAIKRLFSKQLPSHLQPQLVWHLNWLTDCLPDCWIGFRQAQEASTDMIASYIHSLHTYIAIHEHYIP